MFAVGCFDVLKLGVVWTSSLLTNRLINKRDLRLGHATIEDVLTTQTRRLRSMLAASVSVD
jgi:hypothetical protein